MVNILSCLINEENISILHNYYMYTVYLRKIVVLQIKIIYDRIRKILTRGMQRTLIRKEEGYCLKRFRKWQKP